MGSVLTHCKQTLTLAGARSRRNEARSIADSLATLRNRVAAGLQQVGREELAASLDQKIEDLRAEVDAMDTAIRRITEGRPPSMTATEGLLDSARSLQSEVDQVAQEKGISVPQASGAGVAVAAAALGGAYVFFSSGSEQ